MAVRLCMYVPPMFVPIGIFSAITEQECQHSVFRSAIQREIAIHACSCRRHFAWRARSPFARVLLMTYSITIVGNACLLRFFLAVAWLSSLESSLILVLVRLDCCGGKQYCSLPKRINDVIKVTLRKNQTSRVPTPCTAGALLSWQHAHTHVSRIACVA